jgi:hypothetical protein
VKLAGGCDGYSRNVTGPLLACWHCSHWVRRLTGGRARAFRVRDVYASGRPGAALATKQPMTSVSSADCSPADEYDGFEYAALPVTRVFPCCAMYFG